MSFRIMLSAVAATCLMQAGAALAHCDDGETVVRFSHVVAAEGHPKGEAANYFARRVNTELDGKLCMEVYPDSSRFEDDEALEAILDGDLELAAPSSARFDEYSDQIRLFDLPFLFRNEDALQSFAASDSGRKVLSSLEPSGLVGIGYWLAGFKQFSADRPLLTPADAKGLTFRVQDSELSAAMIEALGATPLTLPLGQTCEALESGKANGQENTWSNIVTQGFDTVQDGFTQTDHQAFIYVLVTSRAFLDGLDEDTREQFLAIAADATREANAHFIEFEEGNRRQIEAKGSVIRTLDDAQRRQWLDAMRPVWDRFTPGLDPSALRAAQEAGS